MPLNCGAGEDSWESFGQQGDQTSQVDKPWILTGRTDAEAEAPVSWSPDATASSLEKSLVLGNIEGRRRRGRQRIRWLDGLTDAMGMNLGKLREMVRVRETWCAVVPGVRKGGTRLGKWTTINSRDTWVGPTGDLALILLWPPSVLFSIRALWATKLFWFYLKGTSQASCPLNCQLYHIGQVSVNF